jgi:hypothetical protein
MELLAEADVITAVDLESGDEEAVYGRWAWESAMNRGREVQLTVVRVELDAMDDVEELKELVDRALSETIEGEPFEDDLVDDADD